MERIAKFALLCTAYNIVDLPSQGRRNKRKDRQKQRLGNQARRERGRYRDGKKKG